MNHPVLQTLADQIYRGLRGQIIAAEAGALSASHNGITVALVVDKYVITTVSMGDDFVTFAAIINDIAGKTKILSASKSWNTISMFSAMETMIDMGWIKLESAPLTVKVS